MPVLTPTPNTTGGPGTPPGTGPRRDWQFLIGPSSGGWSIPLSQATGKSVTWRLTDSHEATFTVNATAGLDAGIVPLSTDLHILFAGVPVFRGRIMNSSDVITSGNHLVTFTAESYKGLLNRRIVWDTSITYTNTDVYTIASKLLALTQGMPGGNLFIGPGIGSPALGVVATKTVTQGDLIAEKIDDLAYVQVGGFDWDITPHDAFMHTLDLWLAGHDANRGVMLQYGDSVTGNTWTREVDNTAFADALLLTGTAPASGTAPTPVLVQTTDVATRAEGRWDAVFQNEETNQALLQGRAVLQLGASAQQVPAYTIPLQRGMWGGPTHIWIGDTIKVVAASEGSNSRFNKTFETVRVLELDAVIDQDSSVVTLLLGSPRRDLRRQLRRLARELRKSRLHRAAGLNPRSGFQFF